MILHLWFYKLLVPTPKKCILWASHIALFSAFSEKVFFPSKADLFYNYKRVIVIKLETLFTS